MDEDQPAIVKLLRSLPGCTVEPIGKPLDLLIGWQGVTILAEVKSPPGPRGGTKGHSRNYNAKQQAWVDAWRGAPPLKLTLLDCIAKVEAEVARQKEGR